MYSEIISGYNLYELLSFFFIYSFLGWCIEVIYSAIKKKTFINRGFLNGTICPIYGFGAILVLIILKPVSNNGFLVFLLSALITTTIELVTGIILKKIFHKKWWDYSDRKLNFKGYICLEFSIFWGLGCLLVYDVIHPGLNYFLKHIPKEVGTIFLVIFSIILIIDFIITISQIIYYNKDLFVLKSLGKKIRGGSNKVGEKISNVTIELNHKYNNFLSRRKRFRTKVMNPKADLKDKRYGKLLISIKDRKNKKKKEKQNEED